MILGTISFCYQINWRKVQVTDFEKKDALVVNSQSILQDTQNNTYVYKIGKSTEEGFNVEKIFVKVVSRYKGESCIEPLNGKTISAEDQIVINGAKGITEADLVTIQ